MADDERDGEDGEVGRQRPEHEGEERRERELGPGIIHECAPLPGGCDETRDCASCSAVCDESKECLDGDADNTITCSCLECA